MSAQHTHRAVKRPEYQEATHTGQEKRGLGGRRGQQSAWELRFRLVMRTAGNLLYYLMLATLTTLFVAPLVWMVSASLKPEGYVFDYPPTLIAERIQWWNYSEAWSQFPFWNALKNTMTITVGVLVGRLLTASLTAYVFARLRFPGRAPLFMLVLSTMMIPYQVTLIPQYLMFRNIGWLDSGKPLVWPSWFGGGAYFVFLLRQFFMSIPHDYDDAARIDGCGTFGVFWRVILPMAVPALGTVAIFTFMGGWNDFFGPIIYLNTQSKYTLAVAIRQWQRSTFMSIGGYRAWRHIMAMCTILTLPPTLVYFFTQRYFVQGLVVSGIKG